MINRHREILADPQPARQHYEATRDASARRARRIASEQPASLLVVTWLLAALRFATESRSSDRKFKPLPPDPFPSPRFGDRSVGGSSVRKTTVFRPCSAIGPRPALCDPVNA